MKIQSIQTGLPQALRFRGREILTGIFKKPVPGPIFARTLNLEGDKQADLSVHGGRDKAIYAYSSDAYSGWKDIRPNNAFEGGAMGENLTVDHLPEDRLYIGDTFKIGAAVVQVTQPRLPCYKLAAKFNDPQIIRQFMSYQRPGVYFRVIEEGLVNREDRFDLIAQDNVLVSVLELFAMVGAASFDLPRLRDILKLKTLNDHWRRDIESKIEKHTT
jgi:MOSC domain-containing protein YiiM